MYLVRLTIFEDKCKHEFVEREVGESFYLHFFSSHVQSMKEECIILSSIEKESMIYVPYRELISNIWTDIISGILD